MRESAINRVVIVRGQDSGHALWWVGPVFREFIERERLTDTFDLCLDNGPRGITVWEGTYIFSEDDYEPSGEFRALTDDEWTSVRRGENPWPADVVVDGGCSGCFAPKGAVCARTCPLSGEPEGT